jgi:hypothetical protein
LIHGIIAQRLVQGLEGFLVVLGFQKPLIGPAAELAASWLEGRTVAITCVMTL